MKRAARLVLLLCTLTGSADGRGERYAYCHEEEPIALPKPNQKKRSAPDDWQPLPSKRSARFTVAKYDIFDVAERDPMPSRRVARDRPKPPPPPVVVLNESRNDWRCVGTPRGTAGIIRTIGAPPGARFYRHNHAESWRQDNMDAAGLFNLKGAIPVLRRELKRPIPSDAEPWRQGQLRRNQHSAARALADLGDKPSGPAVVKMLRQAETRGFNQWRDSLDSLLRIDAELAQRYALELIERGATKPAYIAKNKSLFTDLLPLVTKSTPEALRVLKLASGMLTARSVKLPNSAYGGCAMLAKRLELGDTELTRELRAEVNKASLRTQRGAHCYSKLMPVLYPGTGLIHIDVLTYRHRYAEILDGLAGRPAPSAAAKRTLLVWLHQRSKTPKIAGGRTHRDYSPITRALHLAALSALGDAKARREIAALIRDPKDAGVAPWIAARQALRLALPGAADLAAERLRLARRLHTRRFSTSRQVRRGAHLMTEQAQLVEALAERGDPRFVLGLLGENVFAREYTIFALARRKPPEACDIIARAAAGAKRIPVDVAFWALSVMGTRCRTAMKRLVSDPKQPAYVRGMANEHLAMLRDQSVVAHAARLVRVKGAKQGAQRSLIILRSRE